jgi:hypothetical protein
MFIGSTYSEGRGFSARARITKVILRALSSIHVPAQDSLERKFLFSGASIFANTDLKGKKSLYNKN